VLLHVSCAECSMMLPLAGWDGCALLDCLLAGEIITMSAADIAEGAIATVVREGDRGGGAERVPARPIADFYPPREARPVCFLKVPSPRHQYPDRNLDLTENSLQF
jgi:hypothetical protein